uniref:Calcineurin-like phosphoesterase domain-containing protein n=1 Tax=viral metagenome TaxID=1070528 RepID=A0A6M3LV81_9ZZZZ
MEVIIREIEYKRADIFTLYPFFDPHLGARECAESMLKDKVAECAGLGRLGIAIGGGDFLDCITHNDRRFSMNGLADWVEKSNIVDSQRRRCEEIFKPITERKQWLGMGTGNHEEMIHIFHDDDVIRNLCRDMNAPYAGYHAFYILKFKRSGKVTHSLTIHSWHGAGAAQTEGARLSRLVRLVNDIQADIYLMGHLHTITTYTPDRLTVKNGRVKSTRLVAAICGSWLKTYNQADKNETQDPTYGEKKGYKPARIGMPLIKIIPDNYDDNNTDEFTVVS